jgi:putative membrane protein
MCGGMMGGFGVLWMLVPLLFWGGLLAIIVWLVVRIFPAQRGGSGASESPRDSAEEILRGRFARGEINAEEYERSVQVLRNRRDATPGGV